MEIKRVEENDRIGEFINVEFSEYAADCDVALNFEEFCFVAEDDGKIAGVIIGRAYYNEVHIGDLIRRSRLGYIPRGLPRRCPFAYNVCGRDGSHGWEIVSTTMQATT